MPEIAINEVMASNSTTISDEDGDYPDWIEFMNTTNQSINLNGYGLSDDADEPFKWVLPDITLDPESFLLIWASGKDRIEPDSPLHTNFAIAADGEQILLTHPDGTILDSMPPTEIPTDLSFGRKPDGSGDWFLFDEPTPGSSNSSDGYQGELLPPVFSHESGFYTSSFDLTISHEDPQVEIIYTLDGSEPELNNLQGTVYSHMDRYLSPQQQFIEKSFITETYDPSDSIPIRDRTSDANYFSTMQTATEENPVPYYFPRDPIFKGTVIRARAVKEGSIPSPIVTQTYFVTPEERDRFSLPVLSISVQEDHFFGYERGIYVPGKIFDDVNPDNSRGDAEANHWQRGEEWERFASLELFEPESSTANYNNNLGVRIHGGFSRFWPMKSLRMYARSEYGENRFRYQMFPDQPYSEFNRLILRNGGNDWDGALIRDPLLQSIVKHMKFDTQAYRPFILFLNGEYWGVHSLRERYDVHFLNRKYDVDTESIDLLTRNAQVVDGDNSHYLETLDYIRQNGLESEESYEYIQTRIDIENYIDHQISHIFVGNLDWPGNNVDFWRKRTSEYMPFAPPMHDGRWRWLVYDMDFAFHRYNNCDEANPLICGPADHNTLAMSVGDLPGFNNGPSVTELFRALLKNEQFRIDFMTRYLDQLNTAFLPDRLVNEVSKITGNIDPEMSEHFERWFSGRSWHNYDDWKNIISTQIIPFAEQRPAFAKGHLKEYFDIENERMLTVNLSNKAGGYVQINTVQIQSETPGVSADPYPWSGTYFEGVPVKLTAIPSAGYRFSHWLVDSEQFESIDLTLNLEADTQVNAVFEESEVISVEDLDLIHFFTFSDNLPNDTPLTSITSTYSNKLNARIDFESSLEGYPFNSGHPFWRLGSMERRNQPTPINYRPEGNNNQSLEEFDDMRALQIREPLTFDGLGSSLILKMPTLGFDSIVFSFAAKNEGAQVNGLLIDYSLEFNINGQSDTTFVWIDDGLSETDSYKPLANDVYQLYTVDFSDISNISDHPDFRIRIRFDTHSSPSNENRVTFNNIALDGITIPFDLNSPYKFLLGKNYPNPFNSSTTIPFTMIDAGHVRLEVFNSLGQRVAVLLDREVDAGDHQIFFEDLNMASGVYIYRFQSNGFIQSQMMVLIK